MLSQWIFLTNLVISSSPYRTVLPVPLFFYSSFHFTTFSPFIIDAQNIKNGKFMMMHKSEVGRELCRQVRDFPTRINLELARKLGKQSFIEQQKLKRHTIPSPKFTCKDRTLRAWSMPHYWMKFHISVWYFREIKREMEDPKSRSAENLTLLVL